MKLPKLPDLPELPDLFLVGIVWYGALTVSGIASVVLKAIPATRGFAVAVDGPVVGGAIALCGRDAWRCWHTRRKNKLFAEIVGQIPKDVEVVHGEDKATLFVTRHNGEIVTLEPPDGYHPSQDGGAWLFEQLLPEKMRSYVETHVTETHVTPRDEAEE
jgi:hypothetical protein